MGGSSSIDLANLNLEGGGILQEATAGDSEMDDADSEVGAPIHPVIETSEKTAESTEEPKQTTTEEAEDQPRVPKI